MSLNIDAPKVDDLCQVDRWKENEFSMSFAPISLFMKTSY